jgi:hypothetical protein
MWLNESVASGMALYYHFIRFRKRGLRKTTAGRKWEAITSTGRTKHDAHLKTRRSIANIGVVMGPEHATFLQGARGCHSSHYMRETTHGLYEMLLSGRFAL